MGSLTSLNYVLDGILILIGLLMASAVGPTWSNAWDTRPWRASTV